MTETDIRISQDKYWEIIEIWHLYFFTDSRSVTL